ncbi:hypothetical protein [Aerosakkonema sp. BLCC-F183]
MIWRVSAIALFEKAVKHKPGFLKKPGLLCVFQVKGMEKGKKCDRILILT